MNTKIHIDDEFVGLGGHVSHSQIYTFTACSLKWWFSRNFEPDFVAANLPFGRGIHAGIEAFYRGRSSNEEVSHAKMLEAYDLVFADTQLPILYGANDTQSLYTKKPLRCSSCSWTM